MGQFRKIFLSVLLSFIFHPIAFGLVDLMPTSYINKARCYDNLGRRKTVPLRLSSFLLKPYRVKDVTVQLVPSTHESRKDGENINMESKTLLLLSWAVKGNETFNAVRDDENIVLSKDKLLAWESSLGAMVTEIRTLKDKKLLLQIYISILEIAAPQKLDPLQLTTFELIANAGN